MVGHYLMGTLFLFASAGFLLGGLLVGWSRESLGSVWCLALAGIVMLGALGSRRLAGSLLLALVCGSLGFLFASQAVARWDALPATVVADGEWIIVKRELPKAWYQPIIIAPAAGNESTGVRALWRAPKTVELEPGERIRLRCELKRPENFDPRFDYARYLATRGIGYLCERGAAHEPKDNPVAWRSMLARAQGAIRSEMTGMFPEPAAGLLQGLFLGGDDALSPLLSDSFRRAGLSHVVAVSGYNMTLVAFAVLFLALSIGLWRKTATLLAMLGIFVFLLLIDTSAASIRAALMAWAVFVAFFLGRPASVAHGLMLAALLMALENPLIVRYDVGFQLSLLATIALIISGPWLERLTRGRGWGWKLLALPLATIAIEMMIFPVIAFHFGTISLVGPLANTLVLPLIPLSMAFGFAVLLFALVIPGLATVLAVPAWLLLTLIVRVAENIGSLGWAVVEGITPTPVFLFVWYIVLGGLVWYSRKFQYAYVLRLDQSRHTR